MKLNELIDVTGDNAILVIDDVDHEDLVIVVASIGKSKKPFYEASKEAEVTYLLPANGDGTFGFKGPAIAVKVKGLNYVSGNLIVIED